LNGIYLHPRSDTSYPFSAAKYAKKTNGTLAYGTPPKKVRANNTVASDQGSATKKKAVGLAGVTGNYG